MKFFKWAYNKREKNPHVLLTEYAISENISQAQAMARMYQEMREMGVYP